MNTEDKAKELVEKFIKASDEVVNGGWVKPWIDKELAKQCALIVVDEILKCAHYSWAQEYWKEVKTKIEKL